MTSCFQSGLHPSPQAPHHLHLHFYRHTHTLHHHTRFYSWMKSINGSTERVVRQWTLRPGQHANPGFPGLHHKKRKQKKLLDPSGCTIKNETLVCWVISQSRQVVLVSVCRLKRAVGGQISGGLFLTAIVNYWRALPAPAPGQSDTTGALKKQTEAE